MMSEDEIKQLQQVEYFNVVLTAYFTSSFERDKSLLALSAGGIGLLITLLTAVGASDVAILILYIVALLSFLVCLGMVLAIFQQNSAYIRKAVADPTITPDPILTVLDQIAIFAFATGALFTTVIGVSTAVVSYLEKDKRVSTINSKAIPSSGKVDRSVNGFADMRPKVTTGAATGASNSGSGADQQSQSNASAPTVSDPSGAGATSNPPPAAESK